jgi:hypothetical protein
MTDAQILENLQLILQDVGSRLPYNDRWRRIQSVTLKLPTSLGLPVYQRSPASTASALASLDTAMSAGSDVDSDGQDDVDFDSDFEMEDYNLSDEDAE